MVADRGKSQPGEHRQLELIIKSNSRTAFVLENALDPNE